MNGIDIAADGTVGWAVRELSWVRNAVADVGARHEARRWPNVVTTAAWGVAWMASSMTVAAYFLMEALS